jgi:PKD repeat protein/sugar lactone lactonase YvrE
MGLRCLVRTATIAVWCVLAAGAADLEAGAPKAETLLLSESFESSWPAAPWRVTHPEGAADVVWGRADNRQSDGMHSIWCGRTGSDAPPLGEPVPANTESWTIAGPFDLSEARSATWTFDYWLTTEQSHDIFMWLVSTDGHSFSGSATSTDTHGWRTVTVDLANWEAGGDVLGYPAVWIAFVYQSDHDNRFEGAYVDNVRLAADAPTPGGEGVTYSDEPDFAQGTYSGTAYETDALRLSSDWYALPYLWVPNFVDGTVSKVDIVDGRELGRYRTGPERELFPSPVAVDLEGAAWVGNRAAGTVVKVAHEDDGACVDRNANGVIDTSSDIDDDGDIAGNELLAWGADECVLYEVVLTTDGRGTYIPGDQHDGYALENLQTLAVDRDGNLWAGVAATNTFFKIDGETGAILTELDVSAEETSPFGLVIDRAGNLWASSWPDTWVLRVDPSTGELSTIGLDHGSRGMALDDQNHLFVTGFDESAMTRIDVEEEEAEDPVGADFQSDGAAVTSDGDVWVAVPSSQVVRRYSNEGVDKGAVQLTNAPTAVAVDGEGKVWVLGVLSERIERIDPASNQVDLQKDMLDSGGHDASGDLTGIVARTITTSYGSWTAVHDSDYHSTHWGTVSWKGSEPEGTAIRVRIRSSSDGISWSGWERAVNGGTLSRTPSGQYLQVEVGLQNVSGDSPPTIEELTVTPVQAAAVPEASFNWTPPEPAAGNTVQFSDTSTGPPASWQWDFGDGNSSSLRNPLHSFADEGQYRVTLTVSNDSGSDSASHDLTVIGASDCKLTCSTTVPQTGEVDQIVAFAADAAPADCSGSVSYEWHFGDGETLEEQNPNHTYASVGTYQWQLIAWVSEASCTQSGLITIAGDGPESCSSTYWLPVATRTDGAFNSFWRTDLSLFRASGDTAAVELRFHGPEGVINRVISAEPGAMVVLTDVVDWLSPGLRASGSLEVCSDGELVVNSRTHSQLDSSGECLPGGSFGMSLGGDESVNGLAEGETAVITQLQQNTSFRTNIGVVNTGTDPATVEVTLFDGTGTALTTYQVELEPAEWEQKNRPFLREAGANDLDAAWARISVTAGSGVFAYATVIDNITNDPTAVTMRR